MRISKKGVDLLIELEGLKLRSYKCSADVWTIGLGNTFYENGERVKENEFISEEDAFHLFFLIATKFEKIVNKYVTKNLTQNQFNSLFCFVYNIGETAFKNSTLLRLVNVNPNDGNIAKQFLRWNKIKGNISTGLTNRRIKESNLYYTK